MTIQQMMDMAEINTYPITDEQQDELAAEVMRRCYHVVMELHEKYKALDQMELKN